MGRLSGKHWALITGFLAATAIVVSGLDQWGDLLKPAVVGGLMGQFAAIMGAIFANAPEDPNLNRLVNPGRREGDPRTIAERIDVVSEATRRNL